MLNPDDIDSVFEYVVADIEDSDDNLNLLCEYFYNNFFCENARFPRLIWNHYDNQGPRTTNHVEGWHNALNLASKIAHPNIWNFIRLIQTQHISFSAKLLLHRNGA